MLASEFGFKPFGSTLIFEDFLNGGIPRGEKLPQLYNNLSGGDSIQRKREQHFPLSTCVQACTHERGLDGFISKSFGFKVKDKRCKLKINSKIKYSTLSISSASTIRTTTRVKAPRKKNN